MTDFWTPWRLRAKRRKKQITRNIRGLHKFKTLLYVGANKDRIEMLDLFHDWGYEIDVLEVWPPNVEELKKLDQQHDIFREIICGDIMDCMLDVHYGPYDVVMFWHGPEHIKKKFLSELIFNMERLAKHFVIMAAPIGKYEQGEVNGNPHEIHEGYLYPEDFDDFRYEVDILKRRKNKPRGSNMVIWRKLS